MANSDDLTDKNKTKVPWIVFAIGLATWPLVFGVGSLYKTGLLKSRTVVEYSAYVGAIIGFLCCVSAPFFAHVVFRRKIIFSLLALAVFLADCYLCSFVYLAVFRVAKD
jgi:hypothetical protein